MKQVLGVIAFIISFVVSYHGVQLLMGAKEPTNAQMEKAIEQELPKVVEDLNKGCPVMVDEVTRLDKVWLQEKKTIGYGYTIIGLKASDIDGNATALLKEGATANLRGNADSMRLAKHGVSYGYIYKLNGKVVAKLSIKPEDLGFSGQPR